MSDRCRHWQGVIAEQALSGEPQADPELEAHLATCAECSGAVTEVRATTRTLAHTTPASIEPAMLLAPAGLDARILARVDHARHVRRTRRALISVAGAAAAAILLVVTITNIRASAPSAPTDHIALVAGDVHGDVVLQTRAWGTEIRLTGTGLAPGQRYNVWLEQSDGTHVPAGTLTGVRNTKITVVLASALPASQAVALGISRADGGLVVRSPLD